MGLVISFLSTPAILFLLWKEEKISLYLAGKTNFKVYLIFSFSFLTGFILIGINLTAKWWIIDDHEIAWFLGSKGTLSLFEIPRKLLETEVGKFGTFPRLRPSYYFLRLLETALWGDSPFLWYFARLIMFSIALSFCWYLIQSFIGFISAYIICLFTLTFSYWIDIWTRMGPGEIYTVPGLSIFVFSYFRLIELSHLPPTKKEKFYSLLLGIGSFLTIGSKENFLLLAFPLLGLGMILFFKKRLSKFVLAIIAGGITYSVWLGFGLFLTIIKSGKDVYLNETTPLSRIIVLFQVVISTLPLVFIIILLLVIFQTGAYLSLSEVNREISRGDLDKTLKSFLLVLLTLLLVYISQGVFYNGNWPTGIRYDFPGLLVWPGLFLFTYSYIFKTLRFLKFPPEVISILKICVFLTLFLVVQQLGFVPLIIAGFNNSQRTNEFTQNIDLIATKFKETPTASIVFESHSFGDLEPLLSVKRLLVLKGITNDFFIRVHNSNVKAQLNELEEALKERIQFYSLNGGSGEFEGFKPIIELKPENTCLSIGFSGEIHDNCTFVLEIW